MQNRVEKVKSVFPDKISVIWVVHSENLEQTIDNVKIAVENWLHWVFLINHGMPWEELMRIFKATREKFRDIWMWINLLDRDVTATMDAVWQLEASWSKVDWVWVDNPEINWVNPWYDNQDRIELLIEDIWWNWLYFWWVAFKYMEQPRDLWVACREWQKYLDVITTSWPGTWKSADIGKVKTIRELSDNHPIWLASWVDDSNLWEFAQFIDVAIVASSLIKKWEDWRNIRPEYFDPEKVKKLSEVAKEINKQ